MGINPNVQELPLPPTHTVVVVPPPTPSGNNPPLTATAVHPKVFVGAIAGSITLVLTWALETFTNVVVPTEIAQALTVIVSATASYFTTGAQS